MGKYIPCPFCGSNNIWNCPGRKGTTKGEPFLYCRDCGAEGPYKKNDWNTRNSQESTQLKDSIELIKELFRRTKIIDSDSLIWNCEFSLETYEKLEKIAKLESIK